MTTKSLLLIASLAFAGLAFGKSYDIVLSSPTQAGAVKLQAGEYSLKNMQSGEQRRVKREELAQATH